MADKQTGVMVVRPGSDVMPVLPQLNSEHQALRTSASKINCRDFPKDFTFGAASSAYQVEGAYAEDGKSLNNWDVFSLSTPGKTLDGNNGCVAIDQYHRYQEDVMLLKKAGFDAYRFSISWSRVLPGGGLSLGKNMKGIKHYNDLINFCLAQGIEPYVTILHFDIPQCLADEYGGFLSRRILKDFVEFAELCFWEFGDRVKHWFTINEPNIYTIDGYVMGLSPPAHGGTAPVSSKEARSDPFTDPYTVVHHLILAHALAVDVYKRKYQAVQGGEIGIVCATGWYEPLTDSEEDKEAALRALDFDWGWILDPIVFGDYPESMRKLVAHRLPEFTEEEKKLVKGSYDFLGLNYYTSNYASNDPHPSPTTLPYYADQHVTMSAERDGMPIGPQTAASWLHIVPYGIYKLLGYIKNKYNNPLIYITENGVPESNNMSLTVTEALDDKIRILYHQDHLYYITKAIKDGVNVKAYFIWSLLDGYEYASGFPLRFGIFYVDYVNRLTRYPKNSAIWWMNFMNRKVTGGHKRPRLEASEDIDESAKRSKQNDLA